MNCPYCDSEMTKGRLVGSARTKVRWRNEDEKFNWIDMSFKKRGLIDAYYSFWKSEFEICGHYCEKCGKIIINARPEK